MNINDLPQPRRFLNSRTAAMISLGLCLPFVIIYLSAVYELEPLTSWMAPSNDALARQGQIVILMSMLLLPIAFLVNLFSMVTRTDDAPIAPFKLSLGHLGVGAAALAVVLAALVEAPQHDLRPFVAWLGPAAGLGRGVFFAGLLVLPVGFWLNLGPGVVRAVTRQVVTLRPTSINLIVGAVILQVILMLGSALVLEAVACGIGVPNCD